MKNFAIPKDAERQFEERGYFVVRQIIDADAVRAVRDELARIIAEDAPGFALDGTLVYILLPFLPDGLTFDPETRVLSGTPLEALTETTYTFSALDADGDVASLTFPLAVQMPSPDLDGDGTVTFADFLTFAGRFGSRRGQEHYDARCDLDGDGQIGFADFLIFANSFGPEGG